MTARPQSDRRARRPALATTAGTLAVALCSSLVTGCGGSSDASGGNGAPPPAGATMPPLTADRPQKGACGLVTQAEVEAALGAKVLAGKEDVQPSGTLCSFTLASAADQSVVLLSTTSSAVPAAFNAARDKAGSPQSLGAGDEAFVSGAQALVRKGDTMVAVIVVVRQQPAQLSSAAGKLAQAVGTHL